MKYIIIILFFNLHYIFSQNIRFIETNKENVSFRSISVIDKNIFWVGGSKGTIGKTINGGNNFTWFQPKNFAESEFRAIYGIDSLNAFALSVTKPAAIIYTKNGGFDWETLYIDTNPKAFLDAIDCYHKQCVAIGDPITNNDLYWVNFNTKKGKLQKQNNFKMEIGEAFFAASGTNLKVFENKIMLVSGGLKSRIIVKKDDLFYDTEIPILQGSETRGANGFDYLEKENVGIIVGGDFNSPDDPKFNMVLFSFNTHTNEFEFDFPMQTPQGYRSSVAFLNHEIVGCCGINGVDLSIDGGKNWQAFSNIGFHVIKKLDPSSFVLAGNNGKISIIQY